MKKKVERFEDLIAWQKARTLTADINPVSSKGNFSRDFALRDQIRSCAVSVPSNIAEGFERWSLREFHKFLSYAKGSCGELETQLYIARDVGYLSDETLQPLLQQAESVSEIIGRLRSSFERPRTQDAARRTQHQ
jgi:four helix bundle protein